MQKIAKLNTAPALVALCVVLFVVGTSLWVYPSNASAVELARLHSTSFFFMALGLFGFAKFGRLLSVTTDGIVCDSIAGRRRVEFSQISYLNFSRRLFGHAVLVIVDSNCNVVRVTAGVKRVEQVFQRIQSGRKIAR